MVFNRQGDQTPDCQQVDSLGACPRDPEALSEPHSAELTGRKISPPSTFATGGSSQF